MRWPSLRAFLRRADRRKRTGRLVEVCTDNPYADPEASLVWARTIAAEDYSATALAQSAHRLPFGKKIDQCAMKIHQCIGAFVEGGSSRSIIVKLHAPFKATWKANPGTEHPAASLLKIPLVGSLLTAASENEAMSRHRVSPEGLDPTCYLTIRSAFSGSTLTLLELSALAILTSDNAAASYILNFLGVEPYRRFLKAANCENTDMPAGFTDENFVMLEEIKTTAIDQIRILEYIWTIDYLHPLREWMANNLYNTRLSARTEPPDVFAHKTGTLSGSVHDVGVLTTPQLQAFVAVLTSAEVDSVATSSIMANLGRDLTEELKNMAAQYRI